MPDFVKRCLLRCDGPIVAVREDNKGNYDVQLERLLSEKIALKAKI